MKKITMAALMIYSLTISSQATDTATEDCYSLAYKFGSCVARSYKGLVCKLGTDIIMPPRCNDKPETKAGMKAGMQSEG